MYRCNRLIPPRNGGDATLVGSKCRLTATDSIYSTLFMAATDAIHGCNRLYILLQQTHTSQKWRRCYFCKHQGVAVLLHLNWFMAATGSMHSCNTLIPRRNGGDAIFVGIKALQFCCIWIDLWRQQALHIAATDSYLAEMEAMLFL